MNTSSSTEKDILTLKRSIEALEPDQQVHVYRIVRLHHNEEGQGIFIEHEGYLCFDIEHISQACTDDLVKYIAGLQKKAVPPKKSMTVKEMGNTKKDMYSNDTFTQEEEAYLTRCTPRAPTLLQKRVLRRAKDLKNKARPKRTTEEKEEVAEDEGDPTGTGEEDDFAPNESMMADDPTLTLHEDATMNAEDGDLDESMEDDTQNMETTEAHDVQDDDDEDMLSINTGVQEDSVPALEDANDVVIQVPTNVSALPKDTVYSTLQKHLSDKGFHFNEADKNDQVTKKNGEKSTRRRR